MLKERGIFSSASRTSIGFGQAKTKTENKTYWVAEDTRDGCVSLRLLGSDLRPIGSPKHVRMIRKDDSGSARTMSPTAAAVWKDTWKSSFRPCGTLDQEESSRRLTARVGGSFSADLQARLQLRLTE